MANPKPLMAKSSGTDLANAAVESALRTLDAEAGGIAAIPLASASSVRSADATAAVAGSVPDDFAISGFGLVMSHVQGGGATP